MNMAPNIVRLPEINKALLTWQDLVGRRRRVVGLAQQDATGMVSFRYILGDNLDEARQGGFEGYPAFPYFDKEYTNGVLQSFESRLPSSQRRDFAKYLEYWFVDVDAQPTTFQLLAHTGAALPRDGFRFLPVLPTNGVVEFVTELAGSRYYLENIVPKGSEGQLIVGQQLVFRPDRDNEMDPNAVEVLRKQDGFRIGYLMRGLAEQARTWNAEVLSTIARINGTEQRPIVLARVRADFNKQM